MRTSGRRANMRGILSAICDPRGWRLCCLFVLFCRKVLPYLAAITGGHLLLGHCVSVADTEYGPIVQLRSKAAALRARKGQRSAYSVPGCDDDPLKRAVVKICLKRLSCSSCISPDCTHRKLCRSAMPDAIDQLQDELALSLLAVPPSILSRHHIMFEMPAAVKRAIVMRGQRGIAASVENATVGLTQPRACDCPMRACYQSACAKADASGAQRPPAPSWALPRLGRPLDCRPSQRCSVAPAEVRNVPEATDDDAPLSNPARTAGSASSPGAGATATVRGGSPFSTTTAAADTAVDAPANDAHASSHSFFVACLCGRGFCGCGMPWVDAGDPDKETRFEMFEEAEPVGRCRQCLVSIGLLCWSANARIDIIHLLGFFPAGDHIHADRSLVAAHAAAALSVLRQRPHLGWRA